MENDNDFKPGLATANQGITKTKKAQDEISTANSIFGLSGNAKLSAAQYKPDAQNFTGASKASKKEFGNAPAALREGESEYIDKRFKESGVNKDKLSTRAKNKLSVGYSKDFEGEQESSYGDPMKKWSKTNTSIVDPGKTSPEYNISEQQYRERRFNELGIDDNVLKSMSRANRTDLENKIAGEYATMVSERAGKKATEGEIPKTQATTYTGKINNDTEIKKDPAFDEKYKNALNAEEKLKTTPEGPLAEHYKEAISDYEIDNRAKEIRKFDPSISEEKANQIAKQEYEEKAKQNEQQAQEQIELENYNKARGEFVSQLQKAAENEYTKEWANEQLEILNYTDQLAKKFPDTIKPQTAQQMLNKSIQVHNKIKSLEDAGRKEEARKLAAIEKQKSVRRKELIRLILSSTVPAIMAASRVPLLYSLI